MEQKIVEIEIPIKTSKALGNNKRKRAPKSLFRPHIVAIHLIFFSLLCILGVIFAQNLNQPTQLPPLLVQCPTCAETTVLEPTTIFRTMPSPLAPLVIAPEPSVEPIIPEETPVIEQEPARYGFSDEELYLLTVLLSGSKNVDGDGEFDVDFGRSDEYDQISLVLGVVMNRVRSDLYPDTVSEVVWASGQFEVMPQWANGLPDVSQTSYERVTEWCAAYDTGDPGVQSIPEDHLYFSGDGYRNHSR